MKENHYGMVEGGDKKEKLVGACEGFVLYVIIWAVKKKQQLMPYAIRIIN